MASVERKNLALGAALDILKDQYKAAVKRKESAQKKARQIEGILITFGVDPASALEKKKPAKKEPKKPVKQPQQEESESESEDDESESEEEQQ